MKKLKSLDSLTYMLVKEEEKGTDKKIIEVLRKKILETIEYNKLYKCSHIKIPFWSFSISSFSSSII